MITDTDHGTLLGRDEAAIVWSPSKGWCIYIPEGLDPVPDEVAALAACGMRLESDHEFRAEQVKWVKQKEN